MKKRSQSKDNTDTLIQAATTSNNGRSILYVTYVTSSSVSAVELPILSHQRNLLYCGLLIYNET